jgi:hypothetical protein
MKPSALANMPVEALVDRFAALAMAQDEAILDDDIGEVNRLFAKIEAVKTELKTRPGDQRTALIRLYEHPNLQVRLKAAKATLAVAPERARKLLDAIANSHEQPQAGDAGMCLWALDEGIFKPE